MPPRIAPVFLALAMGLAHAAAQEPKLPIEKNDTGLDFRIVSVPESVFSAVDPSDPTGARRPKQGVRRIRSEEIDDFDVTELLSKYGVSFPPGSMAAYCGVLVVRDTAPNLALIDQIFGKRSLMGSPISVYMEFSTCVCALPAAGRLLPWEELTYSMLEKLPKGSMQLVDRISITGKSGQRCVSTNVINPATPDGALLASGFGGGESGSTLEVEPVVGPDGKTIDLNVACQLRARTAGPDGKGVAELKFTTSFSAWNDFPLVAHSSAVSNQPGKYFVVVARVKLIEEDDWILPPPKPGVKPGVIATAPKTAGKNQPPPMSIRRYKVPPGFLNTGQVNGVNEPMEAMKFLKAAGVEFPPGSMAVYDKATSTLIIVNTEENLDLVDQIVEASTSIQPCIVSAELAAYECDFSEIKDPHPLEKLTFAQLEQRPRGSVKLFDSASLITKSGQRAVSIDVGAPDFSKATNDLQQAGGQFFRDGETGTVLEVEPVVGPDGKTIDASVTFHFRMESATAGGREITEINNKAAFTSRSGDPQVVMVSPVENHKGKYIVVVMRMRVLNLAGWSIKSAENTATSRPHTPPENILK